LNYTINTGFEDGTTIKVETSNRKLFFRIEEIINNFQFQNEESNRIEPQNTFQNELDLNNGIEKTENDGNEENFGIGFEKHDGNEENQNKSQKNRGNEEKPLKKSKYVKKGYENRKNKAKQPPLDTKWGKAYFDGRNYVIRNKNSIHNNKGLHKAIYEDYHKLTLFPQTHIHHIDKNPLNNSIDNLMMLSASEHSKLHGQSKELSTKIKQSKSTNTSGYFRVCKLKDKRHPNSDLWRYLYRENNKQKAITAKTIPELERKVKAKGLPWQKL